MKNVLKTLTGILLVFAMVVTTGINSNAAGIKTNDGYRLRNRQQKQYCAEIMCVEVLQHMHGNYGWVQTQR